jgi:ribosomal-protein-alanine N-acetyltransferase
MAYSNPELAGVFDANNVRDVALAEGMTPAQAVEIVRDHFVAKGVKCAYWVMNPSAPVEKTRPMVEHLLSLGYAENVSDILLLDRIPGVAVPVVGGVRVIPARASFKHAKALFEESARKWKTPELADAIMMHMDDPHWDALLAIKDGVAVAHGGVLAVGEVGRIDEVYVAEAHRGKGLGMMMMARVLEICARSLFKHVMLSVLPSNVAAQSLYRRFGFAKMGEVKGYFAGGVKLQGPV